MFRHLQRARAPFLHSLAMAAAAGAALAWLAPARAANISPVQDHPLISRYAGSTVVAHVHADYDEFSLPQGPYRDGRYTESRKVEGEITRFVYQSPKGRSLLEVWRNYTEALAGAGFHTSFECEANACGGQNAAAGQKQARPAVRGDDMQVHNLLIGPDQAVRLMTAHLDRAGTGGVDVVLLAADTGRADGVGVMLTLVEPRAMTTNQVVVDARAIQAGIARDGHIALYGIQFDTDSARLTAASDATLMQMAAALKARPDLKVYIVGHTDNTGTQPHNLTLSQQRADSVVAALSTRFGIDAGRLGARGVASYAPVASNDAEAGRAKNRRVEMVLQ